MWYMKESELSVQCFVTYMSEDKLHLKNTSRVQSQTLESYEMQNSAWMFIFLSCFNRNYIPSPQVSFPPLLMGKLGLIIIHNSLCEKKMCTESHIYCRKARQEPPPLTLTNFTNNEETENMHGGKTVFLIQQTVFLLTQDSQWYQGSV